MRVVIVGATGNVGTSLIRSLQSDEGVHEIVGVARRRPEARWDKVDWVAADITNDDLLSLFGSADAVVHLAWAIQPSRDLGALVQTNVNGTRRVLEACARAEVPSFVYASSVGAYSPGPKDSPVDESWPTEGIPTSFYSRHKAMTERMLDAFENEHPDVRTVRLRPGLIFKAEAGPEVRRLFLGPLVPTTLMDPRYIPIVPRIDRLIFQCVHSHDVGEAFRLAVTGDASGAFNIATDPILDPDELARVLGARPVGVSTRFLRTAMNVTWKLHLQPSPPGWIDMALNAPVMDTRRAREVLGWHPERTAAEALLDLLQGIKSSEGLDTPPLKRSAGGVARLRELTTRMGARQ